MSKFSVPIDHIGDNNYHNIKIAKRQYLRFAGANMHINTIFPNYGVNMRINLDEISRDLLGEFDFSKIL